MTSKAYDLVRRVGGFVAASLMGRSVHTPRTSVFVFTTACAEGNAPQRASPVWRDG